MKNKSQKINTLTMLQETSTKNIKEHFVNDDVLTQEEIKEIIKKNGLDILVMVIDVEGDVLKVKQCGTNHYYKVSTNIPILKSLNLVFKKGDELLLEGAKVYNVSSSDKEKNLEVRMIHTTTRKAPSEIFKVCQF